MSVYQEPFFTRGPSPLARLTFFALLAIAVMIADHRFHALGSLRGTLTTLLAPIERVIALPGKALDDSLAYFVSQERLLVENRQLQEQVLEYKVLSAQALQLSRERALIASLQSSDTRENGGGVLAEIIRDTRNPLARRIIINRGSSHDIVAGLPVISAAGVVGQVTSVGLTSAEITLTTEKDQAVPVMVTRTGQRAMAVGSGRSGQIEVPFLPLGADIQEGDQLVTSGIDGSYPVGLPVAQIVRVDKNPAFPFAKVAAQPVAAPDHHRFVKVLLPLPGAPAYPGNDVRAPDSTREAAAETRRESRRRGR